MAFFDSKETRSMDQRTSEQLQQLKEIITHAKKNSLQQAKRLRGFHPSTLKGVEDLQSFPVLYKADLAKVQAENPPFGDLNAAAAGELGRIYRSPNGVVDVEGPNAGDWWHYARALYAAGLRKGDLVHNSFSYHLTPGGMMLDSGARALGCTVFPAGPGNTSVQAEMLSYLRASAFVGVPETLNVVLKKADELGYDVSSLTRALVSGGPLFPSVRRMLDARVIQVRQAYATADVGVISYESGVEDGMVVDEDVLVEIVRPGTGDPMPVGEVGEVVVTTLTSWQKPMIRFATGDLSAVLPGQSACGRTNIRLKGWLGRADQTTKVRGMFVYPAHVDVVLKRLKLTGRARLEIDRKGERDTMVLKVEHTQPDSSLAQALADSLQAVTGLRTVAQVVTQGSLANDGKIIDDLRDYEN